MSPRGKLAVVLLINFSFIANDVLAQLPPISFESPEFVPWEPVYQHDPSNWHAFSGSADITGGGQGFGGGQALRINKSSEEAWLRRDISWNAAEQTAFIDFQIKPAAEPEGSLATFVANGSQIAFQVPNGSNTGQLWVFNGGDGASGSSQWFVTPGSFIIPPGAEVSSTWSRVTLRHDYLRNIWDLFIDGKLAAVNLAFEDRGTNLSSLEFFGGRKGDTLIDDLSAQTTNMLFPDADKDGLPDDWEIANGSNPNAYDRDSIKPGTNKSFLDYYLESLWVSGSTVANGATGAGNIGTIPPLTILGNHQPVGALKGSFSVGGDGSATYSIPIDIPKGTAGMEPKISLGYSSSGGNGIAGLGWGINGFQRITRGASTVSKDGLYDPLDFDDKDRFFLDGERLICVSGVYGAAGSQYRTEIDSFARITAIGTGPVSWKVETKAGLILYLGETADSKSGISAGALSWGVNRVEDTTGNFYSVEYAKDSVGARPFDFVNERISAVHYTGNTPKGLSPYCHVYFDYEDRPDISRAYTAHAGYHVSRRLSKIRVTTENYTNHSYQLGYQNSYQSGKSLLTSVTKMIEDNPALAVPATTFNYDGLKADEAIWRDPGTSNLVTYSNALDATANVNSMVTVEDNKNTIRLTGDASRAYLLPDGGVTLYPDSIIEFDFKSDRQTFGAMIGLDDDTIYQYDPQVPQTAPTPVYRIGGSGNVLMSGDSLPINSFRPFFNGPIQPYLPGEGWKTFSFNAAQFGTGPRKYLMLMCIDQEASDGSDEAVFRNVRIYRSGSQQPAQVLPIQFDLDDTEIPRLSQPNGKDSGVMILDLDSDGLPDLADWRVFDYPLTNPSYLNGYLSGTLAAQTSGKVFRNTGSSFTLDPAICPPSFMPLSNGAWPETGTKFNEKHHLLANAVDVDADGSTDLLASVDIKRTYRSPAINGTGGSDFISNEYALYSLVDGVWTAKTAWALPFRLENIVTAGMDNGGKRRDLHFEWIDVNSDGYPDLAVHTSAEGRLFNSAAQQLLLGGGVPQQILGGNSTTVFINKGKDGPGWVQDDSYGLPEPLLKHENLSKDAGRRLADFDGDGVVEILESSVNGAGQIRHTYRQTGTGGSRWNSTAGLQNPPADIYDLPVPLVDAAGNDQGNLVVDLNGDRLPDIISGIKDGTTLTRKTWLNHGGRTGAPWVEEAVPGTAADEAGSYILPVPLHYKYSGYYVSYGYEVADINGDGFLDILYANEASGDTPGSDSLAIINSGSGWRQREEWKIPGNKLICENPQDRMDGKRRAKLADINGDGYPDLITNLIAETPRIWYNQCRPEVMISAIDGFGADFGIEYRRLNDPTPAEGFNSRVYEKGAGSLPGGQSRVINSSLVVSRYSESDGMGGRRYKSQRYGDLRYDHDYDASLGFGWIETLDEVNGQQSRTEMMREYPFAGSPSKIETFVLIKPEDIGTGVLYPGVEPGLKRVTLETAEYKQLTDTGGVLAPPTPRNPGELTPDEMLRGGRVYYPVQVYSQKTTFDLNGTEFSPPITKIRTTITQKLEDFDAFGFVKKATSTSLDDSVVQTVSAFVHDETKWFLGRLTTSTVTKSGASKPTLVKTAAFTYFPATGLLSSETVEPGDPLSVTKSYGRDSFGNINVTSVAASGKVRNGETFYDTRGRFVIDEKNQLGQGVSYRYDPARALLLSSTDLNGNISRFNYDAFGTLIRTDHPGGTQTGEITGFATNTSLPSSVADNLGLHQVRYFRAKETSRAPVSIVYLDATGRELVTETTMLRDATVAGTARYSKVYTVTRYDERGRKIAVSLPFAENEPALFTYITYDFLDRALTTQHPDLGFEQVLAYNAVELIAYGLPNQPATYSAVRNSDQRVLSRYEDQHGRLVMSSDQSNQITTFHYDHEGRLIRVAMNGMDLLKNTYDNMGNKIAVWEANSGESSSTYNGFGEVISSTNANGQTTVFTYNVLGRPASVAKPEGTYYTYYDDAPGAGIGQPWKITGPSGYLEQFSYDSLGRPLSTRKTQFGETFTTATTYDALGRPLSSMDAGGLVTINGYDPRYSFPVSITLGGGAPGVNIPGAGTVLWQAGTYDTSGRTLTQTLAQGVTTTDGYNPANGLATEQKASRNGNLIQDKSYLWDGMKNLQRRTDNLVGRSEMFFYDSMNRLTISSVNGAQGTVPPMENYSYDPNGNLRTKGSSTLTYGGGRPHAVTSANVKGEARTYSYDNAGYVLSDGKRDFTWTSFGQLATVSYQSAPRLDTVGGNHVHAAGSVFCAFDFDAAGNRARQNKFCISSYSPDQDYSAETTLYLGSYERVQWGQSWPGDAFAAGITHRHYLAGVGVYTHEEDFNYYANSYSNGAATLTTVLKDHLGSTDLLVAGTWNGSHFANPSMERQAFDPWGERRKSADWTQGRTSATNPFLTSDKRYPRGYTGHEQLDDSGLIHMNGRIYDPELGRMLSPDPYVQVPEYSQNFNRYSYVMNNPLNMTDPTGFSWLSKAFHRLGHWVKENWRTIVVIVIAIIAWYAAPYILSYFGASASITGAGGATVSAAGYAAQGAVTGAIAGAAGPALNGGDLGDILRGAVVGAVQGAISGGVLHGMETSAVTLADKVMHVAGHGMLGGLSNVAMGGKFQDGFLSAAASAGAGWAGVYGATANSGVIGRTLTAGVIGGTVSVLGGGKFANGAYTAAFQHLLNSELEKLVESKKFEESYIDYDDKEGTQKAWDKAGGWLSDKHNSGDPEWYNSCALRVSIAFNESGYPISGAGANLSNGKYYIISARKMLEYITKKYGNPDYIINNRNDLNSFQKTLKLGQIAIFADKGHVGIIKSSASTYIDPYVPYKPPVSVWKLKEP